MFYSVGTRLYIHIPFPQTETRLKAKKKKKQLTKATLIQKCKPDNQKHEIEWIWGTITGKKKRLKPWKTGELVQATWKLYAARHGGCILHNDPNALWLEGCWAMNLNHDIELKKMKRYLHSVLLPLWKLAKCFLCQSKLLFELSRRQIGLHSDEIFIKVTLPDFAKSNRKYWKDHMLIFTSRLVTSISVTGSAAVVFRRS